MRLFFLGIFLASSATAMPAIAQGKKCYPEVDPMGWPYPVCPEAKDDVPGVTDKNLRKMIDISADAYKRFAREKYKEMEISREEFDVAMERVQEARSDAQSAPQ